ncbi:DNA (cytosine-5)-methyltransferase 1 isoform X2 [Amborella trichopoda]|uniref:DNA (cytosine-5)-methyltransferase 1 isoform X2 n=1 Tax=Amborella trichopoda TaxID=13333 RepID=UPI0009BF11E7|nr:DNA (cytosine-5)-methyltransferase 1 isoform X2 [Amborella trichopoda]|eukprot:XP_020528962.1 DNA (cytosine-5)-methyltransferase 1 isoform X2 [Amborella trichopoda]
MEDRKVLRRSPGMASSSAMLRRSPRMVSSSANMGQTLPSSSFGGSVKETHLPSLGHGSSMEGKKDLRRSPRMASSSANMWRPVLSSSTDNSVKETSSPNVGHGSSRVDCKLLRRSPRMVSSSANMGQTMPSSRTDGLVKEASLPNVGSGSSMEGKKELRRSPRMVSWSANIGQTMASLSTDVSVEETSLPNVSCGSSMEGKKELRRSPRMLSRSLNIGQTKPSLSTDGSIKETSLPNVGHGSSMESKKELRRSPRMLSRSLNIGQTKPSLSTDGSVKETSLPNVGHGSSMESKKELRRSPRNASYFENFGQNKLSSSIEHSGTALSLPNLGHVSSMDYKKALRRSPRIVLCSEKSGKNRRSLSTDSSVKVDSSPDSVCEVYQRRVKKQKVGEKVTNEECRLIGAPVDLEEAHNRWPWRYNVEKSGRNSKKNWSMDSDELILDVRCHYLQADICGHKFNLGDTAYVKGQKGGPNYIGRILEFFETMDGIQYFNAQWFFRAADTVIQGLASQHDKKRIFYSDLKNDNLLDCIVSKIKIVQVTPNVNLAKRKSIPPCDFYYDMSYSIPYSTFSNILSASKSSTRKASRSNEPERTELTLLDLFCGCGGMSTGLSLGAKLSGVNLVTRWALDLNESACQSLKLNHPETEVRNESAEEFFELLKAWEKLCKQYCPSGVEKAPSRGLQSDGNPKEDSKIPSGEYEVSHFVGIRYGDHIESGKRGLMFKVRWKGYGSSEDTWEPIGSLGKCQERTREFVQEGIKANILPLPGDVGIVCGGPPCQGISGYNRFRNEEAPLDDPKNHQLVVFMDIVNFLQPRYVLMENVLDILKFAGGFLGRYALSRLINMNYQARLGIMAAGCYGLPQFRLRVFLWGAHPHEKLPQYPLPTHDVVLRGVIPCEFEPNTVAYDEDQPRNLKDAVLLGDAISDLPTVTNFETRDEMPYGKPPQTEFQRYIRATKHEMMGTAPSSVKRSSHKPMLYDHRPLLLNEDDHQRVCQIPKRKGANFRDLPGVVVGADNKVEWDPKIKRVLLPSGKPLVPDYAMSHLNGKSSKPFARLWWDETVPTVLTRAPPHNQAILHPVQDRVLTVRESGRLQGFPDYYKLCGSVRDRYMQVGNAVAVPVAMALGYAMGLAYRGLSSNDPLITLPTDFPLRRPPSSSSSSEVE